MLPPAKRHAIGAKAEVTERPDVDKPNNRKVVLETKKLDSFSIEDDLVVEVKDVSSGYTFLDCSAVSRSINDNNFDSLYLKNLFTQKSDSCVSDENYNLRLPLFTGQWADTKFISMQCDISKSNSQAISFHDDEICFMKNANKKLQNNDLEMIEMACGSSAWSFFIESDKNYGNVIIIWKLFEYNVYSVDSDEWLIKTNLDFSDTYGESYASKALLFDNRLLVITCRSTIGFVDLSDLLKPVLIKLHTLKTDQEYTYHGMICMNSTKKNETSTHEILLFGGEDIDNAIESFNKITISINYSKQNSINVQEEQIQVIERGQKKLLGSITYFGFETIINAKNERLAIAICSESIIVFNCATNEMNVRDVKPLPQFDKDLRGDPHVLSHGDHIHVFGDGEHFLINLKKLLKDFGQFKDLNSYLFWEQERIVWIAFEKNRDNEKCLFSNKTMSKDVIRHLLSYLKP